MAEFIDDCVCSDDELNELFDKSDTESIISNLIDDTPIEEAETLNYQALLNQQFLVDDELILQQYTTPIKSTLKTVTSSLEKLDITPEKVVKKRRIDFDTDSNTPTRVGSNAETPERVNTPTLIQRQRPTLTVAADIHTEESDISELPDLPRQTIDTASLEFLDEELEDSLALKANNLLFYKFKADTKVRFHDLVKSMKNEKTQQKNWIVYFFLGAKDSEVLTAVKTLLQQDSTNVAYGLYGSGSHLFCLEYIDQQRSVAGIKRILKTAGVVTALIGVPLIKKSVVIDWLRTETLPLKNVLSFIKQIPLLDGEKKPPFKFDELVQFTALYKIKSLPELIYRYRLHAKDDINAQQWMECTCALKYAKDALQMVALNEQGELNQLTQTQYINQVLLENECGNHMNVSKFLLYQEILDAQFLNALRNWLHHRIKKCTLVFCGTPDSGKTMLGLALNKAVRGNITTWHSNSSNFWLQPLANSRFAMIDDATLQFWTYADTQLRTALDGNEVAIDCKYMPPVVTRFPSLVISTNYDIHEHKSQYEYLFNRCVMFRFHKKLTYRTGEETPALLVTAADITAYIQHHRETLDLD